MTSAVTVQDFLNRYEIGATVGVGGKTACHCFSRVLSSPLCQPDSRVLHFAGFAVVKKGKDRKTGQPVAIKVRHWNNARVLFHVYCMASMLCLMQVVDKSRYATGDNSLQREIQVLCKVCLDNIASLSFKL